MNTKMFSEMEIRAQKAHESNNFAELEKSFSVMKAAAETEKLRAEAHKITTESKIVSKNFRITVLQVISAMIIPLVSVLTVLATTYLQSKNLMQQQTDAELRRKADFLAVEDVKWNQFLLTIKPDVDSTVNDITFMPRLREFLQSKRYQEKGIDVIKSMLPKITNYPRFSTMFNIAFENVTAVNIKEIAEISSDLRQQYDIIIIECQNETKKYVPNLNEGANGALCSSYFTDIELDNLNIEAVMKEKVKKIRKYVGANIAMQAHISFRIRNFLIELPADGRDSLPSLTLAGMLIVNVDLQNVDFRKFDLNNTLFHETILKNAIILPKSGVPRFSLTAWWEVKAIDQDILANTALKFDFPYYWGFEKYPGYEDIEKDYYFDKVYKLCTSRRVLCEKRCLSFRDSRTSDLSCNASQKL